MLFMKKRSNSGFSLVEMLVVMVLLSIVSLTIYTTFSNGIKIWQRMNVWLPQEDVNLVFEKFTVDIRNTFRFRPIGFSGSDERLEFPALVNSKVFSDKTVGKVIYELEPHKGLIKIQQDYSQVYSGQVVNRVMVLSGIKSLRFEYYSYDKEKEEYFWCDNWSSGDPPLAVRLELVLEGMLEDNTFTKTVSIPTAS